ncbi:unnamed protein product [Nesidiocoris tenuis]|uniref:Uncharacterized protein n=1 Tax=Nesidiocoris tenuis TaxID=355587 RepID=A0A6H5GI23_9HEMI|nr:unnamed protein product [Nesidiocoris tenuis]
MYWHIMYWPVVCPASGLCLGCALCYREGRRSPTSCTPTYWSHPIDPGIPKCVRPLWLVDVIFLGRTDDSERLITEGRSKLFWSTILTVLQNHRYLVEPTKLFHVPGSFLWRKLPATIRP